MDHQTNPSYAAYGLPSCQTVEQKPPYTDSNSERDTLETLGIKRSSICRTSPAPACHDQARDRTPSVCIGAEISPPLVCCTSTHELAFQNCRKTEFVAMRGQRVLFMVKRLSEADSNPFLDTYSWCCSVGLPAIGAMQHSSSFVVVVSVGV